MRFVSALIDDTPIAGLLDGTEIVPFQGPTELGVETPNTLLRRPVLDEASRVPLAAARLRPLIPSPRRVICVGLNYASHMEETSLGGYDYPTLFTKFASTLTGPNDPILVPPETDRIDYEGELVIVIGESCRRVPKEKALDFVGGYCIANDVSMRDYQLRTTQFLQGKAWDKTTPIGPALVTPDEINAGDLRLTTKVDGRVLQDSRTSLLIFDCATLIATCSEFTQLDPGDLILTGTPGGVGFLQDPPVWLTPSAIVTVAIEGLGEIRNEVRAEYVQG